MSSFCPFLQKNKPESIDAKGKKKEQEESDEEEDSEDESEEEEGSEEEESEEDESDEDDDDDEDDDEDESDEEDEVTTSLTAKKKVRSLKPFHFQWMFTDGLQ